MIILGIESTCDETGASIVKDGKTILSNVVASSADIHEKYGGVFPELACRRHIDVIVPIIEEALDKAKILPQEIDAIAVAKGPGLVGALLIGMNAAKGLSIAWNKPLIGVSHIEAHLYASLMDRSGPYPFPALGFVLSGGHTLLLKIFDIGKYETISTTVDDAIGEAFDKVASLLGLPYPGGPHVERLALQGNLARFPLSPGHVKKSPLDFSFSGLKTAVLYTFKGQSFTDQDRADLAASFQETALRDLLNKAEKAIHSFPCLSLCFGGGVSNNQRLRTLFQQHFPSLPLLFPSPGLTLDNAAMIAGLGYHKFLNNPSGDPLDLEVKTRIPF